MEKEYEYIKQLDDEIENININIVELSNNINKFTIKNESEKIKLIINKKFFQENKDLIYELIKKIIKKCSSNSFSINSGLLINDEVITQLAKNENIKEISLARGNFIEKYSLSKKHYEILKKADKEKIDTESVDKELNDEYDSIIAYNQRKFIFSYYTLNDLKKDYLYILTKIPDDKIHILKYLGENTELRISADSNVAQIIDVLKNNNKSNKVVFTIYDKNTFNKSLYESGYLNNSDNLDNYFVSVAGKSRHDVKLSDYIKYEKMLYKMVEPAKDYSPFEKFLYAYDVVKRFKKYRTPRKDNKNIVNLPEEVRKKLKSASRDLYEILENDYIVCVGFNNLLCDLLTKLGINNIEQGLDIDISASKAIKQLNIEKEKWANLTPEEKHNLILEQQSYIPRNKFEGHRRAIVRIKDEKYGIDGIYSADSTWDNDDKNNRYSHAVMTEEDVARTISKQKLDNAFLLFFAKDINEYNNMLNYILDRQKQQQIKLFKEEKEKGKNITSEIIMKDDVNKFYYFFKEVLYKIKRLFNEEYNELMKKYPILNKNGFGLKSIYRLDDELIEAIYEVGKLITSKNNNKIENETLISAVKEIYKDKYEGGLKEEELNKILEDTERTRIVEMGMATRK